MAGVFDIDLDQPEDNVSDDENEEVLERRLLAYTPDLPQQKLSGAASR